MHVTSLIALLPGTKRANAFTNWMHGDGEGVDWRYMLLGPHALEAGTKPLLHRYGKFLQQAAGAPVNLQERQWMRKLHTMAGMDGKPTAMPADPRVAKSVAPGGTRVDWDTSRLQLGSHYNLADGKIRMAKGQRGPGALAHEMGHAQNPRLARAGVHAKNFSGLGTLTALGSANQDVARTGAATGTALGGLNLLSELDASRRGFKMLRGVGAGRGAALKAFIGIPTYALATAIPALAYKGKQLMGGFKPLPPDR